MVELDWTEQEEAVNLNKAAMWQDIKCISRNLSIDFPDLLVYHAINMVEYPFIIPFTELELFWVIAKDKMNGTHQSFILIYIVLIPSTSKMCEKSCKIHHCSAN
jgi:hypothetical protein